MGALLDVSDRRPVHFVGIGGAGMSARAELFVRRGVTVPGCDVNVEGAKDVISLGVHVQAGHDPGHVRNARAVVYSSAIAPDEPELARARAAGVAVDRRAEALAEVVNAGRLVGVAGTHGKTTTTVMTVEA